MQETMKSILIWSLRIFSIIIPVAATIGFNSDDLIDYSLRKSNQIEEVFQFAAKKATDYKIANGHYPTREEFESWRNELKGYGLYGEIMDYSDSNFPEEALDKFGTPKSDGFVLHVWRGEWSEYYSSWVSKSTMSHERSDYYLLGNRYLDAFFAYFLGIILFSLSFFLAKGRIKRNIIA